MKMNTQGHLILRASHQSDALFHWFYSRGRDEGLGGTTRDGSNLPAGCRDGRVTLLLPAGRVIFRVLPANSRWKRPDPQVLLWQVEDELLADVSQLHAIITGSDQTGHYVQAVDKAWLSRVLHQLAQWGICPGAIHPDSAGLEPGYCIRLCDEWVFRPTPGTAATLPESWCEAWLAQQHGSCLEVPNTDADPVAVMQILSRNLPEGRGFQSAKEHLRLSLAGLPGRRLLAFACILCLVVFCFYPMLSAGARYWQAWRLEQHSFRQVEMTFGDTPRGVPPGVWLENRARGSSGRVGSRFTEVFHASNAFLHNLPHGHVESVLWDGKEMQLHLVDVPAGLAVLAQQHSQGSLEVVVQDENPGIPGAQVVIRERRP